MKVFYCFIASFGSPIMEKLNYRNNDNNNLGNQKLKVNLHDAEKVTRLSVEENYLQMKIYLAKNRHKSSVIPFIRFNISSGIWRIAA